MRPEPATEPRFSWAKLHGLGPIVGLVLLCIAGTLLNSEFATLDNALNVLTRTAFIGIIAVGMCFNPSIPWNDSAGCTATKVTRGFFSRRNLPVPIIVPVVPKPARKWVIRPSVCSQISGPVVS